MFSVLIHENVQLSFYNMLSRKKKFRSCSLFQRFALGGFIYPLHSRGGLVRLRLDVYFMFLLVTLVDLSLTYCVQECYTLIVIAIN